MISVESLRLRLKMYRRTSVCPAGSEPAANAIEKINRLIFNAADMLISTGVEFLFLIGPLLFYLLPAAFGSVNRFW